MSNDKLKQLLENVHAALEETRQVDDETRELVRELDQDIHRLIASGPGETDRDAYDAAMDRARELQVRFQAEHPVAERFFREIVDVLSNVGI